MDKTIIDENQIFQQGFDADLDIVKQYKIDMMQFHSSEIGVTIAEDVLIYPFNLGPFGTATKNDVTCHYQAISFNLRRELFNQYLDINHIGVGYIIKKLGMSRVMVAWKHIEDKSDGN